jgi:hypothetical protein
VPGAGAQGASQQTGGADVPVANVVAHDDEGLGVAAGACARADAASAIAAILAAEKRAQVNSDMKLRVIA